jgi:hypothetical protein
MAKVRCRFCEFEADQKCEAKKGSKVKVNKKRSCQFYKPNEEKILNFLDSRQDIGATTRPDWTWSREARRAERDRLIKREMDQYQTTAAPDSKHPMTGDLSRFTQ